MGHHLMGMSRWTPWKSCAHFDSVERSASANTGSEQHEKLCRLLNHDSELKLDETNMLDRAVAYAANEIDLTVKHHGNAALFTEEVVEITADASPALAGIYGTVDAFFVCYNEETRTDEIHVFDFKSLGKGGVDHTPQLMGYAVAIACTVSRYKAFPSPNTKCVLHVLNGGSFTHERYDTTLAECITVGEKIVNARKHCDAAPHNACEHCKYCKNVSSCPATNQVLATIASGTLASYSAPERLALIEQAEKMLKVVKEQARDEIALAPNKCMECNGIAYAIKTTNGASSVISDRVVEMWLKCQELGVNPEDFISIAKFSKNDVMKLLQSKAGLKLKSKDKSALTAEVVVTPYFETKQVEKLERVK